MSAFAREHGAAERKHACRLMHVCMGRAGVVWVGSLSRNVMKTRDGQTQRTIYADIFVRADLNMLRAMPKLLTVGFVISATRRFPEPPSGDRRKCCLPRRNANQTPYTLAGLNRM